MKAILEFNLPEDEAEHYCAIKGTAMLNALWEIQTNLRGIWKYEELTDGQFELIERIRDSFHSILQDNDINLNK